MIENSSMVLRLNKPEILWRIEKKAKQINMTNCLGSKLTKLILSK